MSRTRCAVVTGAGSGIGRAVSLRLFASGWTVVATDVRQETLAAIHWPKAKRSSRILRRPLDVTDTGAVEALFGDLEYVDGLVNNAGIYDEASLLSLDDRRWARMVDVNLTGAFRCIRAAARRMNGRRGGRIVNIASISAVGGLALASHYAASKAGLISLTRSAAIELAGARVSVNAVLPGYVDTKMIEKRRAMLQRIARSTVPLARIAGADEIAELVEFLMNAKTDYMTGAVLVIDGGLSLL